MPHLTWPPIDRLENLPDEAFGVTSSEWIRSGNAPFDRFGRAAAASSFADVASMKDVERAWQTYFKEKTPMGSLLPPVLPRESGAPLFLLHITTRVSEVLRRKQLLASGGGLPGCVYATVLRSSGTPHNLFRYMYDVEVPRSIRARKLGGDVGILGIEVSADCLETHQHSVSPLDYLRIGPLHAEILRYMLRADEPYREIVADITRRISTQLNAVIEFLRLCHEYELSEVRSSEFFVLMSKSLSQVPSLRVAYFESVLEYCLLFQNDDAAQRVRDTGEMLNAPVKDLVYKLCPHLWNGFSPKRFDAQPEALIRYLDQVSRDNRFITRFDAEHFSMFLQWRVAQNLRYKVMAGAPPPPPAANIEDALELSPGLVGHIAYREWPDKFTWESRLAEAMWYFWNRRQTAVVPYGIMPKGEIGVNPGIDPGHYKVFLMSLHSTPPIIRKETKVDVTMTTRLSNAAWTTLRSGSD